MIERGAKALFAELRRQGEGNLGSTYVEDATDMGRVLIDGRIDLPALMRAAIEAMREPTDAMYDAGDEFVGSLGDAGNAEKVWRAMIDAAL